ncbi:hypothetical protein NSZ01_38150 [Nocardioides szechwanensis]|nr:hypothetical protein NSZ01_38150 [Nocardioides szechwanensis]
MKVVSFGSTAADAEPAVRASAEAVTAAVIVAASSLRAYIVCVSLIVAADATGVGHLRVLVPDTRREAGFVRRSSSRRAFFR